MALKKHFDKDGYESGTIRRGSPDDIARDSITSEEIENVNRCVAASDSTIFNSSGGIDLTKLMTSLDSMNSKNRD